MDFIIREYGREIVALLVAGLIFLMISGGMFDALGEKISEYIAVSSAEKNSVEENINAVVTEKLKERDKLDETLAIIGSHKKKGTSVSAEELFTAIDQNGREATYKVLSVRDPNNVILKPDESGKYSLNDVGIYEFKVRAVSSEEQVISKTHTFRLAVSF